VAGGEWKFPEASSGWWSRDSTSIREVKAGPLDFFWSWVACLGGEVGGLLDAALEDGIVREEEGGPPMLPVPACGVVESGVATLIALPSWVS